MVDIFLPRMGSLLVEAQAAGQAAVMQAFQNRTDSHFNHCTVEAANLTAPPGGEVDGQTWIVASVATGEWAGQENKIATFYNGFDFITPIRGWQVWDKNVSAYIYFDGTDWAQAVPIAAVFSQSLFGITAFPGGGQGGQPLDSRVNIVTTCATDEDSVTLPAGADLFTFIYVLNLDDQQVCAVWPPAGETLDQVVDFVSLVETTASMPAVDRKGLFFKYAASAWALVS